MTAAADVVRNRRAQHALLKPMAVIHRQATEESWARKDAGTKAIKHRVEEQGIEAGHNFDLFHTPPQLASRMADIAQIKVGMSVLEPEAGTGRIAQAVRDRGVEPLCVEFAFSPFQFLLKQGFNAIQDDFLVWVTYNRFDAVLMNPPFSKETAHVMRAFELVKPGGILVGIMSAGTFSNQGKKATDFRAWLRSKRGKSEALPEGTFKEAGTNVSTYLITIKRSK
jgi:hypothetical protein